MGKPDTEKAQAAYVLSDELLHMRLRLDRAEYVMQDITEDYFGIYDNRSEDGRIKIAWEYPRYSTKSDIVTDYLHEIRVTLDELYDQLMEVVSQRKKERESAKV